jgi:hypothetical protein
MAILLAPKDTVDLIVTAAVLGTRRDDDADHTRQLVQRADQIGQQLWDANHASASYARGMELPAPTYSWEPVFDLIWQASTDQADYSLTPQQTLQVERCRLFLSENSREHPDWDGSAARLFLEQLGAAVESRLRGWPTGPGEDPGVLEFRGLSNALPRWTRSSGFPQLTSSTTQEQAS